MTADQSHGPHCANCHTEFALDGSCACSWPTADRTGGEALRACPADWNEEPQDCPDDCEPCGSGDWERMCDDCRFYATQGGPVPIESAS